MTILQGLRTLVNSRPFNHSFLNLLLVSTLVIAASQGEAEAKLSCFQTCRTNCDTPGHPCQGKCGELFKEGDFVLRMPGFILEDCPLQDDKCITLEVKTRDPNAFSVNEPRWTTFPGGCLFKHARKTKEEFNYLFQLGTQVITCDSGNACNKPANPRCNFGQAKKYTDNPSSSSPCFSSFDEDNNKLLFTQNMARGGELDVDMRFRCLLNPYTSEVSESEPCFGDVDQDILPTCGGPGATPIKFLPSLTCDICENTPGCDINKVTEFPSSASTLAPTKPKDEKALDNVQVAIIAGSSSGFVVLMIVVAAVVLPLYRVHDNVKIAEAVDVVDDNGEEGGRNLTIVPIVLNAVRVENADESLPLEIELLTERKALAGVEVTAQQVSSEQSDPMITQL